MIAPVKFYRTGDHLPILIVIVESRVNRYSYTRKMRYRKNLIGRICGSRNVKTDRGFLNCACDSAWFKNVYGMKRYFYTIFIKIYSQGLI